MSITLFRPAPSADHPGADRDRAGVHRSGAVAEAFLRSAAAARTARLTAERADIVTFEMSWVARSCSSPWRGAN